ncbi:MAG TPA: PVC-type heme-binding CxxCH protein, partial [Planctomycetota bacterium]|nr:PVC-type heme-binding CxxCH protein [Planctomycetota bacterium]
MLTSAAAALVASLLGFPQDGAAPGPYVPHVEPASDEAALALEAIQVPDGLRVDLFAAEPMLANPVAFCVDERGRFFVAETFRVNAGVTDTRRHMVWMEDDLASRTVEDRVAMFRKHLGDISRSFTAEHERIRLIEDTDGDGKADRATVFADGFNEIADGIGAGVLARRGDVWFTCIPRLWLLRDEDGDGKADVKKALHNGYGVHVGYYGHDLHGLRFGPDGRLYFSIGDRGLNVQFEGKRFFYPDTGAVLRCEPDGSRLEVFATGLRNPQDLAFNDVGDLFTGDNNSDGGDRARWVHVVEGGDSGWRIGYQFIETPVSRGPWNTEKLWHPRWDGQAAYIIPPIANIGDGPSGLAYYPGTGLPPRYDGHFFLCDFRGVSGMSGIRTFALEKSGASYEMTDQHPFVWSVLATDCDFGPDGAMYISDWVTGWDKTGKGRIYRVSDPGLEREPRTAEVRRLLAEGMERRSTAETVLLLEHADMRVRQEAQFALAERGFPAIPALFGVAQKSESRLARLHATWALGQIARRDASVASPIIALLDQEDSEVRAQAARVLGDAGAEAARTKLVSLLTDPEPRVRYFAAMGLARVGRKEDVAPLLALLHSNADRDLHVRHAAVMALAAVRDADLLLAAAKDAPDTVRLGLLL